MKQRIQDLIKVYYHHPFKIFYINSDDGVTFIKPKGLFISLGIITSMSTLEKIRKTIESVYPETSPRLTEIVSKYEESGQYLNTLTQNEPHPYIISDLPENLMTKEEAEKELGRLRELIKTNSDINLLASTQNLQEIIDRIKNWDEHQVLKTGGEYKIFHIVSNYKKVDNLEYRIGIFVEG